MICVAQRVRHASVTAESREVARIGPGMLFLVGVARGDDPARAAGLAAKAARLRVLDDGEGRMGKSLLEGGEALAVSQFTLLADFSRGHRPSSSPGHRTPGPHRRVRRGDARRPRQRRPGDLHPVGLSTSTFRSPAGRA